jgi:hypothetical protein
LTIQVVMEWASLTVMIINIALALVGLYHTNSTIS